MAKLILSMDGLVLKEIPLTKERTTIGRKPHNDIQIDNLAVSGEHAVIVTILNDSFLEDLGSTNGTVVNGNAIKKHFLQNNDVVELGKYKLKFVGEVAPAGGPGDKDDSKRPWCCVRRQCARPRICDQSVSSPAAQRAAAVRRRRRGGCRWIAISRMRQNVPPGAPRLRPPLQLRALRPAPRCHPLLSGRQCRQGARAHQASHYARQAGRAGGGLTRRPQGYFITHVEGASRPNVNGQQIGPAPARAQGHDVIELGGVKMEFFLKA